MRCEHQPDRAVEALPGKLVHRILDERSGMLHAQHDVVLTVGDLIERGLHLLPLSITALGQRGDPADRCVPGCELFELLR